MKEQWIDGDFYVKGVPGTFQMAINPNDNSIWIMDTRDGAMVNIDASGRNEDAILAVINPFGASEEEIIAEESR